VIKHLSKIVRHDWDHSHPIDLTDEGLLEEFKKHKMDEAEDLALGKMTKSAKAG
jgi:cardiolipin synthase A/B